jgi:hypothetical protein
MRLFILFGSMNEGVDLAGETAAVILQLTDLFDDAGS